MWSVHESSNVLTFEAAIGAAVVRQQALDIMVSISYSISEEFPTHINAFICRKVPDCSSGTGVQVCFSPGTG